MLRVGDLDPRLITVQEFPLYGKTLKKAANSPNNLENKTWESWEVHSVLFMKDVLFSGNFSFNIV